MKSCCFIGADENCEIEYDLELKNKVFDCVKKFINEGCVNILVSGRRCVFEVLGIDAFVKLRQSNKKYKMILYSNYKKNKNTKLFSDNEITINEIAHNFFDDVRYFDFKTNKDANILKKMIDDSDVCVFYYDCENCDKELMFAYSYAKAVNKKVINMFDEF